MWGGFSKEQFTAGMRHFAKTGGTNTASVNPYALMTEKDLAFEMDFYVRSSAEHLSKFFAECALRLSDYSFHLKRARRNSFCLGFSAAFTLMGLIYWIAKVMK